MLTGSGVCFICGSTPTEGINDRQRLSSTANPLAAAAGASSLWLLPLRPHGGEEAKNAMRKPYPALRPQACAPDKHSASAGLRPRNDIEDQAAGSGILSLCPYCASRNP
jgi:hypothetical protein